MRMDYIDLVVEYIRKSLTYIWIVQKVNVLCFSHERLITHSGTPLQRYW